MKGNIFNLVVNRWYIINSAGKIMYDGHGFFDHDEAVIGMARLIDGHPNEEYSLVSGGILASEIDDSDPYDED